MKLYLQFIKLHLLFFLMLYAMLMWHAVTAKVQETFGMKTVEATSYLTTTSKKEDVGNTNNLTTGNSFTINFPLTATEMRTLGHGKGNITVQYKEMKPAILVQNFSLKSQLQLRAIASQL